MHSALLRRQQYKVRTIPVSGAGLLQDQDQRSSHDYDVDHTSDDYQDKD